jgi:hypothetical protein
MGITSTWTRRVFPRILKVLAVSLAFVAAGCGNKNQTPANSATGATGQRMPTSDAAAQPETAAAAAQEQPSSPALDGTVNPFLTSQLQIFIQEKGRIPTDFAEFSRTRLDSVPRTPPGTHWAIDFTTKEVKLVK